MVADDNGPWVRWSDVEAAPDGQRFTCAARRGNTDPPQDCDWPFCGCDSHATKVIETLQECGKL
jgi:hypothetical protein